MASSGSGSSRPSMSEPDLQQELLQQQGAQYRHAAEQHQKEARRKMYNVYIAGSFILVCVVGMLYVFVDAGRNADTQQLTNGQPYVLGVMIALGIGFAVGIIREQYREIQLSRDSLDSLLPPNPNPPPYEEHEMANISPPSTETLLPPYAEETRFGASNATLDDQTEGSNRGEASSGNLNVSDAASRDSASDVSNHNPNANAEETLPLMDPEVTRNEASASGPTGATSSEPRGPKPKSTENERLGEDVTVPERRPRQPNEESTSEDHRTAQGPRN